VRLSVIIPAWNEAAGIERAIQSAWLAGADEVIVADGGSTDDTAELAKRARARVHVTPTGRAAQQNAAAQVASGDVLLFLHADNSLAAGTRAQIELALASEGVVHGALRQRIDAAGLKYRWLERGNALRVRFFGLPYGDQAIFLRATVFRQLGGFPNVPLMEDLILMQKVRRFAWPALLPGPVYVSPRRWQRHGVVRQTLRNWLLVTAHTCGLSPARLAKFYPKHS
jgi:rSAM/selenodomain-associated transferase 2